ncbi:MAG: 4'-phosphopantetheinyl transferase family protein, partial [Vicinamibacterales bacterium]
GTAETDAPEIEARLPAYRTLLSDDEARRVHRFVQQDDAMRFVIGRALARTMLSRYAEVAPRDWPLVIDAHGRPELAARPAGAPDLRFNLTHTPGLVACAVTIGREVGVDVEHVGRRITYDVAERFFSAREVTDLRALPNTEQDTVFFDYWTLKEAYIKARGLGLALPLRQFTFLRRPGQAPSIAFAADLHDDAASWQFAQFWPTADHRMAVAVRRTGDDLPILVEPVVPEVPA